MKEYFKTCCYHVSGKPGWKILLQWIAGWPSVGFIFRHLEVILPLGKGKNWWFSRGRSKILWIFWKTGFRVSRIISLVWGKWLATSGGGLHPAPAAHGGQRNQWYEGRPERRSSLEHYGWLVDSWFKGDHSWLVFLRTFRGETVCAVINLSDDTLMLPEYEGNRISSPRHYLMGK